MADEPIPRIIRCLHVDDKRPPHTDDGDAEFHWRCTAKFECSVDDPPYCPYHLPLYTPSGRVTLEEVQRVQRGTDRGAHVTHTQLGLPSITPAAEDDLTEEDLARLRQHRDDQLTRARAAGLEV